MKSLARWILFSALSLLVASPVSAALVEITGSAGAGFQSWTSANVTSNGKPYWDGNSSDGANKNIGNWLTGTGAFASDPNSPDLNPPPAYWGFPLGDPDHGKADLNFYVSSTTSSNVVLKLEIAGYAGTNEFGYYDPDIGAASRTLLFGGPASPSATATITPSGDGDIGFYIHVTGDQKDEYYYTQSIFKHAERQPLRPEFPTFCVVRPFRRQLLRRRRRPLLLQQ